MNIFRALDINKAHGHDEISIRMLKLSDKSIITPLSILHNCDDTRTFPDTWKKPNIVLVYKNGDKQIVDNYRAASLLPILGNIFARIIFNLSLQLADTPYIEQCILCEINIPNTIGYVVVVYRSPSQYSNEFEEFLVNFDKLLNQVNMFKSSFTVILWGFNARSQSWCWDDITSYEGSNIDSLTTTYGFHQLISDITHLLPYSSSCIDLIFTDQPNQPVDSGVHPTLHGNCHHQIFFSKFNLMIEYLPPYEQLVRDYKKLILTQFRKP